MARLFPLFSLVGFLGFMAVTVVMSNRGQEVTLFQLFKGIPHFDKIGHFFLMGVASFLAVLAISPRLRTPIEKSAPLIVVAVGVLVSLEELSQILFPSRTFSAVDLLCSLAGVAFFGTLAAGWLLALNKKPH